jgi:hypothetical protein
VPVAVLRPELRLLVLADLAVARDSFFPTVPSMVIPMADKLAAVTRI